MTASTPFERIAIIGVGLIGGSWGLALKKCGFAGVRVGCDSPEVLRKALAVGAIDEGEEDFRRAVREADLIILAAPVSGILRLLGELKDTVLPRALVTDVGSTKVEICRRARAVLGGEPLFLGGHPFAGRERSGIENADAGLFENAGYVLTPEDSNHFGDLRVKAFSEWVRAVGARLVVMDPASHDRAAAYLSHLPQLVSTGLASLIAEDQALSLDLAATGFRDVTRLAESPYALWQDICASNLENIQQALDNFIRKLQSLRNHLADGALEQEFSQALKLRERLREKS